MTENSIMSKMFLGRMQRYGTRLFNLGDFGRYVIESKLRKFSPSPLSSPRPQSYNVG